jgi:hypothetical protein
MRRSEILAKIRRNATPPFLSTLPFSTAKKLFLAKGWNDP